MIEGVHTCTFGLDRDRLLSGQQEENGGGCSIVAGEEELGRSRQQLMEDRLRLILFLKDQDKRTLTVRDEDWALRTCLGVFPAVDHDPRIDLSGRLTRYSRDPHVIRGEGRTEAPGPTTVFNPVSIGIPSCRRPSISGRGFTC